MKLFNIKAITLSLAVLASGLVMGQKNQTEQYNGLSSTTFKEMGGDTYTFRAEENEMGNVHVFMTIEYKSGKTSKETMFVPDHEAFPATMVKAIVRSDGSPLEDLNVIGKLTQSTDSRVIFLDDAMYMVWYWQDETSFKLQRVIKAEKVAEEGGKKKGGLKAMKAGFKDAMAASKETDEEKVAPLKEYLKAAIAKQKEMIPAWEAENKEYIDRTKKNEEAYNEYVNKVNSDYWNSEEGQRKLAEMRASSPGDSKVTIKNTGSKCAHIMTGGGTTMTISAGSSTTSFCNKDLYMAGWNDTGKVWNVKGAQIQKSGSNCGGTVEIQGGDTCGRGDM